MSTDGIHVDCPGPLLTLPMGPNSADAETLGEYFVLLSWQVWTDGEGFSGKRPFGDSDWRSEVYDALLEADLIQYGSADYYVKGNRLINQAYAQLSALVQK